MPGRKRYRPVAARCARIAGRACRDSTAASRAQCRPARNLPRRAGLRARTRSGSSSSNPRAAASARATTSSATATSRGVRSRVSDPAGPEPDAGDARADPSHSSRDRRVASSSWSARPETHTSPKLRTVAPRASTSRSRCVTWWPRRTASSAWAVPRMPPPTMVTRMVDRPFTSLGDQTSTRGGVGPEQQVNNWYRPIAGSLHRDMLALSETAALLRSLRGVWDEEAVDELDHALQSAARAIDDGADDELVLAAALHDLAHSPMFDARGSPRPRRGGPGLADRRGSASGSDGLPGAHVAAKRYLVATEPGYGEGPHETSETSLHAQGGAGVEAELVGAPVVARRTAAAPLRRRREGSGSRRGCDHRGRPGGRGTCSAATAIGMSTPDRCQAVRDPHRTRRHPGRPRRRRRRFRPSVNWPRGSAWHARPSVRRCTNCWSKAGSSAAAAAPSSPNPNSSSHFR